MEFDVILMDELILVFDLIVIYKIEELMEDLKKNYIIVIVIYLM